MLWREEDSMKFNNEKGKKRDTKWKFIVHVVDKEHKVE